VNSELQMAVNQAVSQPEIRATHLPNASRKQYRVNQLLFNSWGGVRTSPLCTPATVRLIVPAPGKPNDRGKHFPSDTLSVTNPT
jgi:hypothetical protein